MLPLPLQRQPIKVITIRTHNTSMVPLNSLHHFHPFVLSFIGTVFEALDLGAPSFPCTHCEAHFWYEERLRRDRNTQNPKCNVCCRGGRILLLRYEQPPQPLLSFLTTQSRALSRHFFDHVR
jgi:hypothetical protein